MKEKVYSTNYSVAVHWLNNSLVRCNNIPEFDRSIFENANFSWEETVDIFQWYITDCSDTEVDFLTKNFPGLLFTYSDKLECWVLCVDHFGTAWDYVGQVTLLETAARGLGECI